MEPNQGIEGLTEELNQSIEGLTNPEEQKESFEGLILKRTSSERRESTLLSTPGPLLSTLPASGQKATHPFMVVESSIRCDAVEGWPNALRLGGRASS